MMLVLLREMDESIMIGKDIEIKVVGFRYDRRNRAKIVRLGINAPREVQVDRLEVHLDKKKKKERE